MVSIEEYVRVEEYSLSDYIKRTERKDNSILDSKDQTAVEFNKNTNKNKNYGQYLEKLDTNS